MYVVQYRFKSSDVWSCCPGRYETIEAAAEVLKTKFPASCYRIAEIYTVERYKAVRSPLEVPAGPAPLPPLIYLRGVRTMRKILLTDEETIKLEMFLHMTTQYRKDELDTCQSLAQEKQPDGSDKFPNMLSNAVWWKETIAALENVQKAIDNAPYEENKG